MKTKILTITRRNKRTKYLVHKKNNKMNKKTRRKKKNKTTNDILTKTKQKKSIIHIYTHFSSFYMYPLSNNDSSRISHIHTNIFLNPTIANIFQKQNIVAKTTTKQ